MKLAWIAVVFILLISLVSCEPFALSIFPSYLADLATYVDLSGQFASGTVEHHELFTLHYGNAENEERVFLLSYLYNGSTALRVFDSNLVLLRFYDGATFQFGSRHLVDMLGNFIVGAAFLRNDFSNILNLGTVTGRDGYGNVLGGLNALVECTGFSLDIQQYNDLWSPGGSYSYPMTSSGSYYFKLVHSDRLFALDYAPPNPPRDTAVLVFKDNTAWPSRVFAVLIDPMPGLPGTGSIPILGPGSPLQKIDLGTMDRDFVQATHDGIVVLNADGAFRLIGWDGNVKAVTRSAGSVDDVLIDYSRSDYYYVFDPDTLKLYKSRVWWK